MNFLIHLVYGLWKHVSLPVQFSLVVDDFGVKYVGEENARHLINALTTNYEVSTDWNGSLYCGIKLDWNYNERYLDTSMAGYVKKQLIRYKHVKTSKPQNTPLQPAPKKYGSASQEPPPPDESPLLNESEIKLVQQIVGSFLYYGRAVDPTILHALSTIASEQGHATENTLRKCNKFLDYMAWHPDAIVRYGFMPQI